MTAVIKIGGRAQGDAWLVRALAEKWNLRPRSFVIVHGGGDEVSALQRMAGVEPRFIGGRRVTSADDIDRLRMGLSGLANKRLVAALVAAGINAVGLSGEDARLLLADVADDGALGAVGTVRAVRVTLIRHLLNGGFLPVISPLASGVSTALNVNGDDAASAIAGALGADELLFISDVPAIRIRGEAVSVVGAEALQSADVVDGMQAKLRAALRAADAGVSHVRIGDVRMLNDDTAGTTVLADFDGGVVA